MKTDLITADSPRWSAALVGSIHDVYHLPGYARLFARQFGGEALAFLAEEGGHRLLMPLVVRSIDEEDARGARRFDATCPYGYPGPVLATDDPGPASEDFLDRALVGLRGEMLRSGIVCAFARLHPLIELPHGPFRRAGTLVRHGETVSIDLTSDPEAIWRGMSATCRNEVRKAERQGQVVRVDDGWVRLPEFLAIYRETMRRRSASAAYDFDEGHIRALRACLGDRLMLIVAEIGGEVAAGALFIAMDGIVNYHLSGTRGAFLRHHPSRTVLHHARIVAAARGHRVLHLGGGLGGMRDSLFDFKASFSPARHPFHTWRFVADGPAYLALVRRWRERTDTDPEGCDGFFPAYRQPFAPARAECKAALAPAG